MVFELKDDPVKVLFVNRVSIGFSNDQWNWLCDQVRTMKAESIAQLIRKLVMEAQKQ